MYYLGSRYKGGREKEVGGPFKEGSANGPTWP